MTVLSLKDVSFSYKGNTKKVLKNITAEFESGKIYAVTGESGSGKTTLLSLTAGLTSDFQGEIQYLGRSVKSINKDYYRSNEIGVIFQSYNLLLGDSAVENVELSLNLSKSAVKNKKTYAYELLEKVGIDRETGDRKILKLSGGEQQRVAIARSLSYNPNLLIADEPTGNLDSKNENGIMSILSRLAHQEGKCVIIVTHSATVPEYADVVMRLCDGSLST